MKISNGRLLSAFLFLLTIVVTCTTRTMNSKTSTKEIGMLVDSLAKVDQAILNILSSKENQFTDDEAIQLVALKVCILNSNYLIVNKIFHSYTQAEIATLDANTLHNFWLIVQHCDQDVFFQRSFLDFLQSSIIGKKVNKADIAYLTDRVLINEGKPQRYGTQVMYNENNIALPKELEDLNKVDDLRREMKLEPLQQYLDFMTMLKLPKDSSFTITIKR